MKKVFSLLICIVIFTGCNTVNNSSENIELERWWTKDEQNLIEMETNLNEKYDKRNTIFKK